MIPRILVFLAALALFAISATRFDARVTDISALRMLDGEIPYRDFWTMYAPGSFSVLALVFALVGPALLASTLLGIVTAAAAVTIYYGLARRVTGSGMAVLLAMLVAVAFFGTGYHRGFTSYPPAWLFILLAVGQTARRIGQPGVRWAIVPGVLCGVAALFKHDVAAYSTAALVVAAGVVRYRSGPDGRWTGPLTIGTCAALVVVAAAGALVLSSAGPEAWRDLVRFPLVDFAHVRTEYFPLIPRWRASWSEMARELMKWGICNLPTAALLAGLPYLRRGWRDLEPATRLVLAFAFVVFWLHWSAAQVQLNTNAISLTAWGALFGSVAVRGVSRASAARWRVPLVAAVTAWGGLFLANPVFDALMRDTGRYEWAGLPRLRGVRVPETEAHEMRGLARALADAGDARRPLLLVSSRNDVLIFAETVPFWLSGRRPATRNHELHPGVTDTEPVQRQMLEDLAAGGPAVVVREHRFGSRILDAARSRMIPHVPIGANLLDEWLQECYGDGPRFGRYEVLSERPGAPARCGFDLDAPAARPSESSS